jgi:hypothetical protein
MYRALCAQVLAAEHAIRDLRSETEFVELVQGLVKANWGISWEGWWECLDWNCLWRGDNGGRGESRGKGESGAARPSKDEGVNRMGWGSSWETKNRVPWEEEERGIVLRVVEDWLDREDANSGALTSVRARVLNLRNYILHQP